MEDAPLRKEVRSMNDNDTLADDLRKDSLALMKLLADEKHKSEALAAELAKYKEWHASGRSNVEYTKTGARICRGEHEKYEPCEWESYALETQ